MIRPLLILIASQLAGEAVVALFGLRFPPSIMGMLLLFGALVIFRDVPKELEHLSAKLFPYIPLLLIPISVGVLEYRNTLDGQLIIMSAAIIVSTIAGVFCCALVLKRLLK